VLRCEEVSLLAIHGTTINLPGIQAGQTLRHGANQQAGRTVQARMVMLQFRSRVCPGVTPWRHARGETTLAGPLWINSSATIGC